MSVFSRIGGWLFHWGGRAVKRIFQWAGQGVSNEVQDFANDPDVQDKARQAVEIVQSRGLTDTEALKEARGILRSLLGDLGARVTTVVIDLVIMGVLASLRNKLYRW